MSGAVNFRNNSWVNTMKYDVKTVSFTIAGQVKTFTNPGNASKVEGMCDTASITIQGENDVNFKALREGVVNMPADAAIKVKYYPPGTTHNPSDQHHYLLVMCDADQVKQQQEVLFWFVNL